MYKTKDVLLTGFALFAMLFGAGNLIFPPMLGYETSSSWTLTMLAFIITGVGFPFLGILSVSIVGNGIKDFANRVSPMFSTIYDKDYQGIKYNLEEAKKLGAMMLFGDKYGDVVRVVDVPDFSTELCGGTHIDNIGKIGLFKIVSEGGIAAGVRRIEAKTGYGAYLVEKEEADILKDIEKKLKATNSNLVEKVEKTLETLKDTEKELEVLQKKIFLRQNMHIFQIKKLQIVKGKLEQKLRVKKILQRL